MAAAPAAVPAAAAEPSDADFQRLAEVREAIGRTGQDHRDDAQRSAERITSLEARLRRSADASLSASQGNTPRCPPGEGSPTARLGSGGPHADPRRELSLGPTAGPAVGSPPARAAAGRFSSRRSPAGPSAAASPPTPPAAAAVGAAAAWEQLLRRSGLHEERALALSPPEFAQLMAAHGTAAGDRPAVERRWRRQRGRPPSREVVRSRSRSPCGAADGGGRPAVHGAPFNLDVGDHTPRLTARPSLARPAPLCLCDPNSAGAHSAPFQPHLRPRSPLRPAAETQLSASDPNARVELHPGDPPVRRVIRREERPGASSDPAVPLPRPRPRPEGRRLFARRGETTHDAAPPPAMRRGRKAWAAAKA